MRTRLPPALPGAVLFLALVAAVPCRAQAALDGKELFQRRCGLCHSIEPGLNMAGPSLAGLVGRKVATVPGALYSPAMKARGGVWTLPILEKYLENPQAMVPGTSMPIALPDLAERKAILAYLDVATAPRPAPKKKPARAP